MALKPVVELGSAFVERLAAHLPEDQRDAFKSMLAGNEAALTEIGNGTLRQEDFSSVRDRQTTWWNQNKARLEEADRIRSMGGLRTDGDPNPQPAAPVPPADPNKQPITVEAARDLERQSIGLSATLATLVARHSHEFGEPLDCATLVNEAITKGQNINEYYASTVSARREKKQTETRAAEIAAAEERGKAAGRQEIMSRTPDLPYPVGSSAPTTLAGLRKNPDRPNEYSTDAAVSTLMEEINRGARA